MDNRERVAMIEEIKCKLCAMSPEKRRLIFSFLDNLERLKTANVCGDEGSKRR